MKKETKSVNWIMDIPNQSLKSETLLELVERRFVTADGVIEFNEQFKGVILGHLRSSWDEGYTQGQKDRVDFTGGNYHLNPYK